MKNTVLDCFETTVEQFEDKIAFSDISESISFSILREKSRRIGTALLKIKGQASVIAFYMDKSVSTIVGFLGAVYAGCAYTQINLRYPAERVQAIIDAVSPCVVVTDREHLQEFSSMNICSVKAVLFEELIDEEINQELLKIERAKLTDMQPLYINFTSGSTGKPKGVAVGHRSVIDFIDNFVEIFKITECDEIANQAPFDFDVSVKDIYSGLFTGATVHIIPTSYFMKPLELMDFLCDRRTTVWIWAVSALCFITTMNALEYRKPESLRTIMFSGEVMPIKHLNKLRNYLPNVQYVNLYGPTEITCNCTYYVVNREFNNEERLPIGIPFPNEKVFLLDVNNRIVTESGEKGELCVSGSALALGYYHDAAKTSEVFVQNPNNCNYIELIYKTGDIVEVGSDGQLYYSCRKDNQIKHLGHRIELSEIELIMGAVEGVDRVCCFFDASKDRITAVYTGNAEKREIIYYLSEKIPHYMIPQLFYWMDSFPINKNGKIDRKMLQTNYERNGIKK